MKAIRKTFNAIGLFFAAIVLVSCSKENDTGPEGTSECWYKITIDGQTTLPNAFGQDKIALTGGKDENSGVEGFVFGIDQDKRNTNETAQLTTVIHGLFNSELPTGNYPANSFFSTAFSTPGFEQWPMYAIGDPGDDDHVEGNLTFTLLENSNQRIRMKVSGTTIRMEELGEDVVETGIVPVEAELTIGRKHYNEAIVNGTLIGGAVCECQD